MWFSVRKRSVFSFTMRPIRSTQQINLLNGNLYLYSCVFVCIHIHRTSQFLELYLNSTLTRPAINSAAVTGTKRLFLYVCRLFKHVLLFLFKTHVRCAFRFGKTIALLISMIEATVEIRIINDEAGNDERNWSRSSGFRLNKRPCLRTHGRWIRK